MTCKCDFRLGPNPHGPWSDKGLDELRAQFLKELTKNFNRSKNMNVRAKFKVISRIATDYGLPSGVQTRVNFSAQYTAGRAFYLDFTPID
jgi:hypothetical protein